MMIVYVFDEELGFLDHNMSKNRTCGTGFPLAINTFAKCMGIPPMAKLLVGPTSLMSWWGIHLSEGVCIGIFYISLC